MKKILLLFSLMILALSCNKVETDEIMPNPEYPGEHVSLYAQKPADGATRAAVLKDRVWNPGDVITVKFINGTQAQQDKIKEYAVEWMDYANITFRFVDASTNADIRVAIQYNGDRVTWSAIGTEAKSYLSQTRPTMNFGQWKTNERRMRADVLMQFGHVLGLVNEHQTVDSPFILDVDAVYDEYEYLGWSDREITEFFFNPYTSAEANYTEYDALSIMCWPIENYLTVDGSYQVQNLELSATDKSFIRQLYPPADPAPTLYVGLTDTVRLSGKGIVIRFDVRSNTSWRINTQNLTTLATVSPAPGDGGLYHSNQTIEMTFGENPFRDDEIFGRMTITTNPNSSGATLSQSRIFHQVLKDAYADLNQNPIIVTLRTDGYSAELRSPYRIPTYAPDGRASMGWHNMRLIGEVANYDGTYSYFVTVYDGMGRNDFLLGGGGYLGRLVIYLTDIIDIGEEELFIWSSGGTGSFGIFSNALWKATWTGSLPSGVTIDNNGGNWYQLEGSVRGTFGSNPQAYEHRIIPLTVQTKPDYRGIVTSREVSFIQVGYAAFFRLFLTATLPEHAIDIPNERWIELQNTTNLTTFRPVNSSLRYSMSRLYYNPSTNLYSYFVKFSGGSGTQGINIEDAHGQTGMIYFKFN